MNIKITKSSYKNNKDKRAIIFDCSAKNYRKKINTGVFIDDKYLQNDKNKIPISMKVILEKLEIKRVDALNKFKKYSWTVRKLEVYLSKGIDLYSIEEYVNNEFCKNKNRITANDYKNVIKAFKKYLKTYNLNFGDIMDKNKIYEFKTNTLKSGIKYTSINSYVKKMSVIMNQAYRDGFITQRFEIPKYIIEKNSFKKNKPLFNKEDIIESIIKSEDIYQLQSISIFILLIICGGMNPSDLMNYRVENNSTKKDLLGSIIFEKNCSFIKFNKSKKGVIFKYSKLNHTRIKIIEIVKTFFYLSHYKKSPFILSSYSNQHKIFNFDIEKNNNLYKNLWNFFQIKLREISNYKFSDAKNIYYKNLEAIEMNKITSDILFAKVKDIEILKSQNTKLLKENVELCEHRLLNIISASELVQVVVNKALLLGYDLNKIYINRVKTPFDFSNFLQKISELKLAKRRKLVAYN